jgi:N-acetyl-anhydromuramyl-L-alanine amidase AmpD
MNLVQIDFPSSQYVREEHPKRQIYLHHTAGNSSGTNVFKWWASNPERVATCVAIAGPGSADGDGKIVQGFGSKYWAYHLGVKRNVFDAFGVPFTNLDKNSIGIEICNWGQLSYTGGKFYNYVGGEVLADQVIKLDVPYKRHIYFHNYSDAQIQSVKDLLLLWKDRYGIPIKYNEDIWTVTQRALRGEAGVFTHNSVRADKVDIYPHPKMIEMLKSL